MKHDEIEIEILEDGTIKTTTDKVSMPNHASAEEFLRLLAELAGGEQRRVRRGHSHHHHHEHDHLHAHGGHGHHDGS